MKRGIRVLCILAACMVLLVGAAAIYVSDYYHASPAAKALLSADIPGITVTEEKDRAVFRPEEVKAGLIFYPGGKVEYTAYAPLMEAFARQGFLCILQKMPLNLAFLGMNAADRIIADFPEISTWYIAGHSLGGAAAGIYSGKHAQDLEGLILLGAYSTADLNGSGLQVLSIYGSEDGVLNRDSYAKYRGNLPADTSERVIQGGSHACFGDYGPQKGDGTPQISCDEQMEITAEEAGKLLR